MDKGSLRDLIKKLHDSLEPIKPSVPIQRVIVGLIVVLLGLGFFVTYKQKKEQGTNKDKLAINYVDTESRDNVDTDGDGLYDWEELLWGLNPNVIDTDGDGVSDYQYTQERKRLEQERRFADQNINSNLSETEKFGRSLYTALSAVENSGVELSQSDQESITNNIADYISNLVVYDKLYLRDDLNLVPNSKKNVYAYQDAVESAFDKYPVNPGDFSLILEASENSEPYKTRLTKLADNYDSLIHELNQMQVPYVIAGRHTELMNNLGYVAGSLKNLAESNSDDLVTLSSVFQLNDKINNIQQSFESLNKFFDIIQDESVFEN